MTGGTFDTPPAAAGPTQDERNWAMAAHLASLSNLIFPFGAVLGPLVVWLSKKETSAFVDHHGKESLQFQASFLAYHMVFVCGGVGSFVAVFFAAEAGAANDEFLGVLGVTGIIGLLGIALLVRGFVVVMMIVAAVRAHAGEAFRYPLTIRLLR